MSESKRWRVVCADGKVWALFDRHDDAVAEVDELEDPRSALRCGPHRVEPVTGGEK